MTDKLREAGEKYRKKLGLSEEVAKAIEQAVDSLPSGYANLGSRKAGEPVVFSLVGREFVVSFDFRTDPLSMMCVENQTGTPQLPVAEISIEDPAEAVRQLMARLEDVIVGE